MKLEWVPNAGEKSVVIYFNHDNTPYKFVKWHDLPWKDNSHETGPIKTAPIKDYKPDPNQAMAIIVQRDSQKEAREVAGARSDAISYGRFVIYGDGEKSLKEIESRLK